MSEQLDITSRDESVAHRTTTIVVPPRAPARTPARWLAIHAMLVAAIVGLMVALWTLSNPHLFAGDDFVAFRAASRLLVAGENPYDPDALLAEERAAFWTKDHAYQVWEPPWALALLAPFALPPHQVGRFAWFVANFLLLIAAADRAWLVFGGAPRRRGVSWIVAITFMPAVLAWKTGQFGICVLAGLVAFLDLERRHRDVLAGVALVVFASVKPHIVHLVWPACILWSVQTRRWRVLIGALAAGFGLAALTAIVSHAAVLQHVTTMLRVPPTHATPTIGTGLRWIASLMTGHDVFALAFVPALGGLFWLATVRPRHGAAWLWSETLPALVVVSLVTAPFAWVYDGAVLLVPVVYVLARGTGGANAGPTTSVLATYVAINLLALGLDLLHVEPVAYWWLPPFFTAWYVAAMRSPTPAATMGH